MPKKKNEPTSAEGRQNERPQLREAVAEHKKLQPKPPSLYFEGDGWVGGSPAARLARIKYRLKVMGRRRDET